MRTLDELDRLHARMVAREPKSAMAAAAALVCAWPAISARLQAAEAEVERLRRLCRVAAERIDDDALALAELLDDQDAPVDGGALADALSRAALGEP